jgi:hypothetical protein
VAAKIITQRLAAIVSTDNTILCLDVGGRKEKQETPKSAVKLKERTSRSWNACHVAEEMLTKAEETLSARLNLSLAFATVHSL